MLEPPYLSINRTLNTAKTDAVRERAPLRGEDLADDRVEAVAVLHGGEDGRPGAAHLERVAAHHVQVRADGRRELSSEIKDEICSKLASALRALKSRISRICGINELERRIQNY